ncbi:MAG: hypothetical protein OJF49_002174 [Ktedonobacterales bacterium]|nr:MAG: hypothetical protein OJF49_002174 [Ktedonobacterales bacterium]
MSYGILRRRTLPLYHIQVFKWAAILSFLPFPGEADIRACPFTPSLVRRTFVLVRSPLPYKGRGWGLGPYPLNRGIHLA